ncbi:MAG: hypothetical protein ABIS92_02865 [Polyangia bacterium]
MFLGMVRGARVVWLAVWLPTLAITGGSVGQAGCSFAFVDAPPARATSLPYFDCTSSRLAPNADVALAALFALTAIGAASDSQTSADMGGELTATALGAGMLVSAIHGWKVTADCREAKRELAARLQEGGASSRFFLTDPWWGNGTDLLPPGHLAQPPPPLLPVAPLPNPSTTMPAPPVAQPGSSPPPHVPVATPVRPDARPDEQ